MAETCRSITAGCLALNLKHTHTHTHTHTHLTVHTQIDASNHQQLWWQQCLSKNIVSEQDIGKW